MTAREAARALADTVLYEGYVLYPYRATADKNRVRWQWGVLMPNHAVATDPSERSACRTAVVLDGRAPSLRVTVRFLQVQQRHVEDPDGGRVDRLETADATWVPWDEAREREVDLEVPLPDGLSTTVDVPGGRDLEELPDGAGRLVRVREPLRLTVDVTAERPASPYPVTLVTVRVANRTGPPAAPPAPVPGADARPVWLRRALVACHLLLETEGGSFVSSLDPPEWAAGFVAACDHDGLFPVLAGPVGQQRVMLASPIILYDHAEVAPESRTSFFDGLEVDELLSLRTMTLTDAEKREVRGTDPRAAALLADVDALPAEVWERLHGAIREVERLPDPASTPGTAPDTGPGHDVPWWDPGADASTDPAHDTVRVAGREVCSGSRVLLRPGRRRADAHDLFLAGRRATVAAVLIDVDGQVHLAVTVDDDPGADLKLAHGRFLYFAPDEVEPLAEVER